MPKLTFADVPQYPRACHEVDVSWTYLESWIADETPNGLDLDPDYQRAHVWTREQQRAFIEHVLQGGEVGHQLIFNCTNWDKPNSPGEFTLVDGKQRMEAVRAFLRDEVEVFGGNRCSEMGSMSCMRPTFKVRILNLRTRADSLRLYLQLNAGTPHSPEEIARVRRLLEAETATPTSGKRR